MLVYQRVSVGATCDVTFFVSHKKTHGYDAHSDLDPILLHTLKSYQGCSKRNIFCKKVCLFPPTHHFLLVNSFNAQGVALVLPPQKQPIKPRFFGKDFEFLGLQA